MAITQALKWILDTTLTEGEYAKTYVIMSDSLSALQAIGGSNSVRPELVHRIYIICSNLVMRSVAVVFEWVCSLGYFPFQPVVHNWFIKGHGMYCSVYGKVHIKDPLLLIDSGFPSKKCVNVTI